MSGADLGNFGRGHFELTSKKKVISFKQFELKTIDIRSNFFTYNAVNARHVHVYIVMRYATSVFIDYK